LNKTLLDNREDAKPPGDQAPLIDVSVIIINWNTRQMLQECITSVFTRSCKGNVQESITSRPQEKTLIIIDFT
jgi:hypothetical protein